MNFLAFDLGGSSGKLYLGVHRNGKLNLTCIHRFDNYPIPAGKDLYWDFMHIYDELCKGLRKAVSLTGDCIDSVGFDSFCNDFALIDDTGSVIAPVRCYRDARTARCQTHTYSVMSQRELYFVNGNQNALFNTLLQLDAMKAEGLGWLLDNCHKALFVSDLLVYLLTGVEITEYTTASVTQMFDFHTMDWSEQILQKYGIRHSLFAPVTMPGTIVGKTTQEVSTMLGSEKGFSVSTVCQHDTASAFLASVCDTNCAIISCGTWCLVGAETEKPVISETGFRYNIANEGGYPGHHRLLRNVMGTWIIQEIVRQLKSEGHDITYSQLDEDASRHPVRDFFIDVDRDIFYQPGHMLEKVNEFTRRYYGKEPSCLAEAVSCIYASLAFKYRFTIEKLEELTGTPLTVINMIGGGSQSRLMCQITADICGRPVIAGPADATAYGNIMVQMIAHGVVSSVKEGRECIRSCTPLTTYVPGSEYDWTDIYLDFLSRFHMD